MLFFYINLGSKKNTVSTGKAIFKDKLFLPVGKNRVINEVRCGHKIMKCYIPLVQKGVNVLQAALNQII